MMKPALIGHIFLEVVGAIALLVALWYSPVLFLRYAFKDFSGGQCVDTDQLHLKSPDGMHEIWSFHRKCGAETNPPWDFIYLSTGNTNKGAEWEPIATVKNTKSGETKVAWNSASQLSISYPEHADIDDVYAKIFGITIVLHPQPSPEQTSAR